jgi:Carboxypeptidase regulatory-like domain
MSWPIMKPGPAHFRCCLWLGVFLLGGTPAAAQVATAQLIGSARDGAGSPLSGVTVELVRRGTVVQTAMTDSTGAFRIGGVAGGVYAVIGRLVGYQETLHEDVALPAGDVVTVRLTLEPAPVILPGVDVVLTPIEISRVDTEFGKTIQTEAIRSVPIGHDARDLVALTPGARAGHVWGGATAQANNYQLDGVSANHPGVGGDLIQPSVHWIESIEVRGLGAGAEHGNFQGGLINVITKSGTNRFQGGMRLSGESHRLNASSLEPAEIGSEIAARYDVEGEVRGPLLRDRLFYFLAGQWLQRDARFTNHLPGVEASHAPSLEERTEGKFFGKLSWRPSGFHGLDASVAHTENRTEHWGLSGYETADATLRLDAPTTAYNVSWTSRFDAGISLDARFAHVERVETRSPYAGDDVPGVLTYGLNAPYLGYQNAPLRYHHAPSSTGGSVSMLVERTAAGLQHQLRIGAEHNAGAFTDQRTRNGGMTWRPPRSRRLEPGDPATWFASSTPFVASVWGGEVDLHAEVESSALFAQSTIGLHRRVSISPGVRWGRWQGRLLPGGRAEDAFTAVEHAAPEARIGLILDLSDDHTFVAKAHWGRYHQSMIAQMFDRAAGGDVFSDEEMWFYRGTPFVDPATRFSRDQRDAMQADRTFTRENVITLTETGPAVDYHQPYVDQWIVGLEKTFSNVVKLEAVYVNRRNRNMVALVDRNRATNYTRFDRVTVFGLGGDALPFEGGTVQLKEVYLPNAPLLERLRCKATGLCPDAPNIPGLSLADTARLTWDPDYVLTNVPDARRAFDQFQFVLSVLQPRWSLTASAVVTSLEGNLDNVTGYDDPSGFGAGPYVRVNEGVNSFGTLPNFADRELKVVLFGDLPWSMRGGLFWNYASGDHWAPYFTLASGAYTFRLFDTGEPLDPAFFYTLEGHRTFVGPRGLQQHEPRAQFDLHLERTFGAGSRSWTVSLDLFNLIDSGSITEVNRSVNRGQNYYPGTQQFEGFRVIEPGEFYRAVRQRVPPRTLRLGTRIAF